MLQKIWREYRNAFRLSNFKRLSKMWWFYIYVLTILPCIYHVFYTLKEAARYYLLVIPFLFARLSAGLYPLALPKMMFLCPMDAGERISYLKLCYRLKVAVTTIFAGLCLLVLTLLDCIPPAGALYILFIFFCIALGFNLHTESLSVQYRKNKKTAGIFSEFSVWNNFQLILGVLIVMFSALFLSEKNISSPVMTTLALVGLFLQLLLTGRMLKFYRPVLATAANYETASGLKERISKSHENNN